MIKSFLSGVVVLVLLGGAAGRSFSLPRSAPEAQGVSSAALLAFIDAADRQVDAMNSFMLVRHGHVVAEGWWAPYETPFYQTLRLRFAEDRLFYEGETNVGFGPTKHPSLLERAE